MALIDRIDALPDDMKAICASFAYGRTEEPDEPGGTIAFRVGADVYRYTIPYLSIPKSYSLSLIKLYATRGRI